MQTKIGASLYHGLELNEGIAYICPHKCGCLVLIPREHEHWHKKLNGN